MTSHRRSRSLRRSYSRLFLLILLLTGVSVVPAISPAEQTGVTLVGRVVFRGIVPPPEVVTVTRDPETCGVTKMLQPLAVQSRTNGVLNAVVSIEGVRLPPPVDPLNPPEARETTAIANDHCAFGPHVEATSVGNAIQVGNHDPILHNTHITIDSRTFFNVAMVSGGKPVRKVVKRPGIFYLRCDVHRFMQGYVVAFDHPYYSVTQASGDFRIVGVSPGRHKLTVWHESLGTLQREITVPTERGAPLTIEFP
jgi:plastocyanin